MHPANRVKNVIRQSITRSQCTFELCIFEGIRGLHLSFISAVRSSHVYPHFPYIHSACVFCLCSCHLWHNQLYHCRVNQSRMKKKAHLLPLSFSSWDEPRIEGRVSVCMCVFSLQVPVCVHVANGAYDLLFLGSAAPHFHACHFFHGWCPTAQCESQRHRTGHKTAHYLIKHLWNMTWEMRKVKAVTETPAGDFQRIFTLPYELRPIISIWLSDTVNLSWWFWCTLSSMKIL